MRPSESDRTALEFIAEGVTEVAGFDVAAISVVEGGFLRTLAVAGDDGARAELEDQHTPVAAVLAEIENAEDWGVLKFVPYQGVGSALTDYMWVPDIVVSDEPDAWHPHDLLVALLTDDEGTLRGLLSVDVPSNGRRPGPEQRRILETYARQAERAVITTLERGQFERGLAREHAIAEYRAQLVEVLSHELQNPLTVIQHHAELLRAGAALTPEVDEGLAAIERGAGRIQVMVEDLLVLARVGAPDRLLDEQVDLVTVARGACELLAFEASRRDVAIHLDVEDGDLIVPGDARALDALVANLVSNAVKYSHAGSQVRVLVRPSEAPEAPGGAVAEVVVEDDGVGISVPDQARVFEEFFRSSDPRVRERAGTGLGLAIVERAVALHGGTIELVSEVSRSTRFRVRLPLVEPG